MCDYKYAAKCAKFDLLTEQIISATMIKLKTDF